MSDMASLAAEYRRSAENCAKRAEELRAALKHKKLGATELRETKRRIIRLEIMASECAGSAAVLERYYTEKPPVRPRGGLI